MSSSIARFADQDFAPFADAVGLSTDEFRRLATAAEEAGLPAAPPLDLSVTQAEQANCKDFDFNIKVVRIKGQACFTPGSNWSLIIDLQVSAFGIELDRVKYTFSPSRTSVCYNYNVLFGKLKLCFGVRTSKICLFTSGEVSGFGKSTRWDEDLVCFL